MNLPNKLTVLRMIMVPFFVLFMLTDIGGPKEVGRIRISGNMTEAKELKLIHYSVTGLYKKEIDLLNQ